jgi:uncharacterized protein (DUF169 family)
MLLPLKYNEEIYEKLYFLNDHDSFEQRIKLEEVIKNLPEIKENITAFVYRNLSDKTLEKYFKDMLNNTFLLTDEWFSNEQ